MVWNGGELPCWDERKCPGMRCEGQPWGSSLQLQFYLCKCFTLILPLTLGKGTYKKRKCPRMRCEGQLGGSSLLLLLRFLRTFLCTLGWKEVVYCLLGWGVKDSRGGSSGASRWSYHSSYSSMCLYSTILFTPTLHCRTHTSCSRQRWSLSKKYY